MASPVTPNLNSYKSNTDKQDANYLTEVNFKWNYIFYYYFIYIYFNYLLCFTFYKKHEFLLKFLIIFLKNIFSFA